MVSRNSKRTDLGPIILTCRPLSVKEYISKPEKSRLVYYFQPIVFVVLMLFLNMIIARLADFQRPVKESLFWSILLFGSIVFGYCLGFWWFNIRPRKDYLILCENGMKWKLHLGIWSFWRYFGEVKFEDLETISFRPDSIDDNNRLADENIEAIKSFLIELFFPKGDLILGLKNGKVRRIENILIRFVQEDIKSFLEYLVNNHDSLIC